jgi:recombination protein RecT
MAHKASIGSLTGKASGSQSTIFSYLQNSKKLHDAVNTLAGKYFTPERFLALAVNAVKKTPQLQTCSVESVLGAFIASASLGLEPNTPLQQAFLIPYKKGGYVNGVWQDNFECQFQIGYRGFITLAHRSEHIASLQAEAIHEGDLFDHLIGTESFLKYRKSLTNRGGLIGAFAIARLTSGAEIACVLPLDEILRIRSKSGTWSKLRADLDNADPSNQKDFKKAEKALQETPWELWLDDMAAKSAIKKLVKQLPISSCEDPFARAVELDSDDSNVIDLQATPSEVEAPAQQQETVHSIAHQPGESVDFSLVEPGYLHEEQHQQTAAHPQQGTPRQQKFNGSAFGNIE